MMNSKRVITTFRAGRCDFVDGWVTARKEKGRISLFVDDLALTHFEWKPRQGPNIELDKQEFILVADDAKWQKVPQCTTGRVFLLDYGEGQRFFYWLQEPNTDKDEEYFLKVQKCVSPQSESGGATQTSTQETSTQSLMSMLQPNVENTQPSQQRSAQTLTRSRVIDFQTPVSQQPEQQSQQQQQQQQQYSFTPEFFQAALSAAASSSSAHDVDLVEVLKPETLLPIVRELLKDEQNRSKLTPHLPESQTSEQDIEKLIRSPQFQQTLKLFAAALRHGNQEAILLSLGIPVQQINEPGVQGFLKAIQSNSTRGKGSNLEKMDDDKKGTGNDQDDDLYG